MKNRLFTVGRLLLVLIFGMTIVGCDDPTDDTKEVDAALIGKWEWQKINISETMQELPIVVGDIIVTSTGGYDLLQIALRHTLTE